MGSYLLRGILIGLLFGVPAGAVGAMTAQRTLQYGVKAGLLTGLGSSVADCLYACVGVFIGTYIWWGTLSGGVALLKKKLKEKAKEKSQRKLSGNPKPHLRCDLDRVWYRCAGSQFPWQYIDRGGVIMIKKSSMAIFAAILISITLLMGCGAQGQATTGQDATTTAEENAQENTTAEDEAPQKQTDTEQVSEETDADPTTEEIEQPSSNTDTSTEAQEVQGNMITVEIGGQSFQAELSNNETAKEFVSRLPMTLSMDELNGNEKYAYLDQSLPSNAENVGNIQAGDIMLFGSDCLVLFFEDFNTSYRYTRIGCIQDKEGFTQALGSGTVEVIFQANK